VLEDITCKQPISKHHHPTTTSENLADYNLDNDLKLKIFNTCRKRNARAISQEKPLCHKNIKAETEMVENCSALINEA
jgi:hypothetical protein